ncbi:hypothetical protein MMC30_005257 [Trapelia coarctata]|nr:hypothetical protein [Trapelia coarctata]
MTTATGTFTSCGGGQLFSLTYQCTGPSCTNLNGFPNTTCTTDGTTLQCSNGVTCPGSANYTSTFNFLQENVMVTSNQVVKTNCGDFTVTSDGTTGGTKISITDTTNACAPDTSLNSTGTGPSSIPSLLPTPLSNGTNGTATTLPSPPAQSSGPIIFTGAAASYRSPTRPAILCLLLLAISLLVQGTTAFHQQSGQLQASPKEARGTELDLSFAVPAELEVRELDARDLSTLYSDFAKNFAEYLANKITNAANSGGKGDVFANNLIAEISEAVCDHFVGGAISNVLIGDLVEECIAAVYTGNALVAPELEFLSIFGAALLCNAAVNEIIPQIGDLTDALCKGPKPCGNLLTDPNNCGACGNVVSNSPTIVIQAFPNRC